MNEVAEIMSLTAASNRRAYQSPRLSLLGDVASLTEAGSMDAQEDAIQNNSCNGATLNNMGNMC